MQHGKAFCLRVFSVKKKKKAYMGYYGLCSSKREFEHTLCLLSLVSVIIGTAV